MSHPMALYNLQQLITSTTPITYGPTPSPSYIPSPVACYGLPPIYCDQMDRRDREGAAYGQREHARRAVLAALSNKDVAEVAEVIKRVVATSCATVAVPTWIPTTYPASRISSACTCVVTSQPGPSVTEYDISTAPSATSTCTSYTSGTPGGTWAAYCDPSLYTNAIAAPTVPAGKARAETTAAVDNRMDCCGACAGIFNCIYWEIFSQHHVPGELGFPRRFRSLEWRQLRRGLPDEHRC